MGTASERELNVTRDTITVEAFAFERGPELDIRAAYETYGDPSNPAVLVCHALTGSQHVATTPDADDLPDDTPYHPASGQGAGWWTNTVGPGKPIDTDRFFVVCVNVPGSCYGTTGPEGPWPEDADETPAGADFPSVTVGDWTRTQRAVLSHLEVGRLHAVVGGSVGGMNVLEWGKRYPDFVDRVVPIATAARLDPQILAINAVRRRCLATDPEQGLALARQLGHVLYRSKESLRRQFGRRDASGPRSTLFDAIAAEDPYREIDSYLDYNAGKFVERFSAESYRRLIGAMDDYDLGAGAATLADALSGFEGEALLVSFAGDWHFTPDQSRRLATAFQRAGASVSHRQVQSDYGHDAFLAEPETYGETLATFLDGRDTSGTASASAPVHASLFK